MNWISEAPVTVDLTHTRFAVDASDSSRLAGLNLSGINLNGMAFVGWPLNLSGTTLDGASMQQTTLALADLSGASLKNVNAPGASFRGATLAANGNLAPATFAGSSTNLQGADFVDADVSGASFASADLSNAVFSGVLAYSTDFTGVKAPRASFTGAHIYGNGEAFNNASDLTGVDFSGAILAGDVNQGGGFNLTNTNLTGAHFDNAQCIGCNFTGSSLATGHLLRSVRAGGSPLERPPAGRQPGERLVVLRRHQRQRVHERAAVVAAAVELAPCSWLRRGVRARPLCHHEPHGYPGRAAEHLPGRHGRDERGGRVCRPPAAQFSHHHTGGLLGISLRRLPDCDDHDLRCQPARAFRSARAGPERGANGSADLVDDVGRQPRLRHRAERWDGAARVRRRRPDPGRQHGQVVPQSHPGLW